MKCYTTILDADLAILPYFVRHYSRLGATEFPTLVYGHVRENDSTHEAIRQIIESEGGIYSNIGSFPQTQFTARKRDLHIQSQHPKGEWAFFCDVDEFAEIDSTFVRDITSGKIPCSYVEGRWRDRISRGGKLADIDPAKPLEDQYPMATSVPLSRRLGFGSPVYVLSPRAPSIHHPNVCEWGQANRGKAKVVRVSHFKWQKNALRRLRRRRRRINAAGQGGSSWEQKVQRQINHLQQYQGINPDWLVEVGSKVGI